MQEDFEKDGLFRCSNGANENVIAITMLCHYKKIPHDTCSIIKIGEWPCHALQFQISYSPSATTVIDELFLFFCPLFAYLAISAT